MPAGHDARVATARQHSKVEFEIIITRKALLPEIFQYFPALGLIRFTELKIPRRRAITPGLRPCLARKRGAKNNKAGEQARLP